jgi:hypothetical protein
LSPKTVYGDGTKIIVSNSTGFSGNQMYYTPDSATAFNFSASTIGTFATPETHVVKCMNVLFIGSSGGIYKSDDNGQTWTVAGTGTTNISPTYAMYSHLDTLYSGSSLGASFSTDTGLTWTAIPVASHSLVTSFLKTGTILYVGGTSALSYTADNGATWNNVTTPASIIGAAVADLAELGGSVYAGTNSGVYKTSDNGVTWTRVLAQSTFSMAAIDTSLLVGTNDNGVYQSDQAGVTWNQISGGLPHTGGSYNAVNAISFNDNYIMCAAGGDSTIYVIGYSEVGLSATGVTPPPPPSGVTQIMKPQLSCAIYPNPAKNDVTIKTDNNQDKTTVEISDVTGKIGKALQFSGNSINVDVSYLSAGTYFVQIIQGSEQVTRKLVIEK